MACEIELQIGPGATPGEFTAQVVNSAAGGEPTGVVRLDVPALLQGRATLEATVLASAVSARSFLPAGEQRLRGVGEGLFDSLFTGQVYGAYRASLGVARQQNERLRVVLRLTAPELAALPWEALFDPETESYICRREPLVRHVPAPYTPPPLDVQPPLRILGLVASPRGLPALDVPAEREHLSTALADPIAEGLIDLQWLPQATWEGVHAKLLAGHWHVVHFIGHGDYSVQDDQGRIALVDADGRVDPVEAERLADLLGEAEPTPRLVVLNSCDSGESGMQDLFSGTAARLVRSGISAVAAMQFAVSDQAAVAFAQGFYTAIAHGRDVAEATRSGRIAILGAPHTLEWVTPVLYLRGDSARLFNLAPTSAPEPPPEPPPGPPEPPPGPPGPPSDRGAPDRDEPDRGAPDEQADGRSTPAQIALRRTRRLSAVLVAEALLLVIATSAVLDDLRASRSNQPRSDAWTALLWLLPAVPLVAAAWLLQRRSRTGAALGCMASAALWLTISWARVEWVGRGGPRWIYVLLLAALLAVAVIVLKAEKVRERTRFNHAYQAILPLLLVVATIVLHTLAREIVHQHLGTIDTSKAPFWLGIMVPLLIGIPAALLQGNEIVTPALKTLVSLQLGYDVVVQVGSRIHRFDTATVVSGLSISVIYLVGSVCLLLAVWVGQRRSGAGYTPFEYGGHPAT